LRLAHKNEFTYGEIDFINFIPILEKCNIQPGETYWDLGCGAGKSLIAVGLLH